MLINLIDEISKNLPKIALLKNKKQKKDDDSFVSEGDSISSRYCF